MPLSGNLVGASTAGPGGPDPGATLLVGFVPNTPTAAIQADFGAAGVHLVESFADGTSWVAPDPGVALATAQRQLARAPGVAFAEPNATVQTQGLTPNDPDFKREWGLKNTPSSGIDAPQAWTLTTGTSSTIVAVLDTGIDLSNPEFAGRIWTNPDSSGSDGYPGDVHGWNFVANDADVQDDNGHGTNVSGILGAAGNNGIGVAGVDWNAEIMPLKVLDDDGGGTDADVVSAIDFAVQHGARVINASWGGGPYSQAVADAISYAGSQGVVFVTAAGNNGTNNDAAPFYPASYNLPNEIAVAAVNQAGGLAGFSNYGAKSVALAAPGVNILNTVLGGYAYMSGTSMATPFVSGVVALVAGLHPSDTAAELVQQVESTAKPLAGLAGKTATGGIVDAARAVGLSGSELNSAQRFHSARPLSTPSPVGSASTLSLPYGPRRHRYVPNHTPRIASLPRQQPAHTHIHGLPRQRFYAGWPNSWV
jgi:subtilisin family serine protease